MVLLRVINASFVVFLSQIPLALFNITFLGNVINCYIVKIMLGYV